MNNHKIDDILRTIVEDLVKNYLKELLENYIRDNMCRILKEISLESLKDLVKGESIVENNNCTSDTGLPPVNNIEELKNVLLSLEKGNLTQVNATSNINNVSIKNNNFKNYKLENNLKNILNDNKILQQDFATAIEVSRGTAISILNNKSVSLENAFKISEVFGLSIYDIFHYVKKDDNIENATVFNEEKDDNAYSE